MLEIENKDDVNQQRSKYRTYDEKNCKLLKDVANSIELHIILL